MADRPVMEFVSEVIGGNHVQQQDVFGFGIQTRNSKFHLRKHLPEINRNSLLIHNSDMYIRIGLLFGLGIF